MVLKLAIPLLVASTVSAQTNPGPPTPATSTAADVLMPLDSLNHHLPKWLRFTGQYRMRDESPRNIKFGVLSDSYLLGRFRLGAEIQPASWLKFVGVTQDARVYFNSHIASTPPFQNRWDIWEAYTEIGHAKEGWFDFKFGRQVLSFGEERLIGPADWLNQGRTFDAVRLDLHHADLGVSLFSSSVVIARDGVIDHHLQGNNLHGAYGSLKNIVPNSVIEPYIFWRVAPARVRLSENAGRGALDEFTLGFRWVGKLPAQFDYNVEMDRQAGSLGPDSIGAWAGHWNLGRAFTNTSWKPRLFVEGDYASGTKDPKSKHWGTFDQLYPSAHDKLDLTDQVGWRNIEEVRTGIEENPLKNWKLKQTLESFWLASTHDALYAASGAPIVPASKTPVSSHVGEELDAVVEYRWYRTDVVGVGIGHIFAGQFLNQTTSRKEYTYPFVYGTLRF